MYRRALYIVSELAGQGVFVNGFSLFLGRYNSLDEANQTAIRWPQSHTADRLLGVPLI